MVIFINLGYISILVYFISKVSALALFPIVQLNYYNTKSAYRILLYYETCQPNYFTHIVNPHQVQLWTTIFFLTTFNPFSDNNTTSKYTLTNPSIYLQNLFSELHQHYVIVQFISLVHYVTRLFLHQHYFIVQFISLVHYFAPIDSSTTLTNWVTIFTTFQQQLLSLHQTLNLFANIVISLDLADK